MDLACVKHTRGKGLGKSVTGAVVARIPRGSSSTDTMETRGLTARPLAIDQSLILERSCSDSAAVKSGGYRCSMFDAIVVAGNDFKIKGERHLEFLPVEISCNLSIF